MFKTPHSVSPLCNATHRRAVQLVHPVAVPGVSSLAQNGVVVPSCTGLMHSAGQIFIKNSPNPLAHFSTFKNGDQDTGWRVLFDRCVGARPLSNGSAITPPPRPSPVLRPSGG